MQRKELTKVSIKLILLLREVGYISEIEKRELIYRITTGDRAAYRDLKDLLLQIALEIGELEK